MQAVGSALVVVSAVLAVAWCITYHWVTGGHWRDSEMGWSLMTFCGVIAAVLTLSTVRLIAVHMGHGDPAWFQWLRLTVFVGVPLSILWRFRLLFHAQRREETS